MKEQIGELIARLEHDLAHAESTRNEEMQKARLQLEAQIANLSGRLDQRIEDMKAEVERLKVLVVPD